MTTHIACYESLSSRSHSSGSLRPGQTFSDSFVDIDKIGTNTYVIPYPQVPLSGYTSLPVAHAQIMELGDTDLIINAWAAYPEVDEAGTVDTSAGPFLRKNDDDESGINSGRIAPRVMLDYQGLTRPANNLKVQGTIHYAYSDSVYTGQTHFCDFEDFPPDSVADGDVRLKALLNGFVNNGTPFVTGVGASGDIIVNNCAYAGIAPEGFVYIRPEDLGTGTDQIPPTVFTNTAAAFKAHPSVFYPSGKATFVRGITRQAVDSIDIAIVSPGGTNKSPLGIIVVDSAPTFSDWVVVVDGQSQIVRLNHPGGSDLRRPRDIYNQLWVPILLGPSNTAAATSFGQVTGLVDATAFRWQFCDYLRCLPLFGTNTTQGSGG